MKKENFRFTAKDIALHFGGITIQTVQSWARPTNKRHRIYRALQNQMLIELGEQAKEMK